MKRFLLFAFCLAAFATAHAQVPGTLSYQGILVNVAGNPVADGNHTVTFNFHKTATGGVPTFARGPFTVSTFKGLFTLVLGTGTPATVNDPLPVLASDPNYIGNTQYYLELVADNVILSPRVSLSSMPYAFTAQNANTMNASGLTGTVADARLEPKVDVTELTVGSSAQLAVSATGNITKINNVATSFPAAQGIANTLLSNDGSGNLTWVSPATSTSGWGLTGNSATTAGTNFIGTTDAKDIVFKANNVERMRLTSSGNFGFGTNSPFAPFQVAGSLTVGSTGFASDVWVMQLLSTNTAPVSNRITFGTDNTGYKFAIAKNSGTITDLLTIQDNGNVGIGTTNALGKLDVSGGPIVFGGTLNNTLTRPALTSSPINNEIWAYKSGLSTADDGFLRISAGGGSNGITKSFIDISGFSTVADMNKNIVFGTAGTERARIDVNGNLGIGTASPLGALHIATSGTGVNGLTIQNTNASGGSEMRFLNAAGNQVASIYYSNILPNHVTHWINGVDLLQLDGTNARVGIGTNPISKLDVAGDVRLAQTTAPTTTTDKLYNVGGNLYWSGVTISNGNTGTNHFFGYGAGLSNTTGNNNHFEGYSAGPGNTTGSFNYFSGNGAGSNNTTANGNHFSGIYTGFNNTTGVSNYFSGYNAGNGNTTGSQNHFVGQGAGQSNTTASGNHFEGFRAGQANTTGAANLFIGSQAGRDNITGSANHFVGEFSGLVNTTGERNYFSGHATGNANTTGSENHFEGYEAGYFNTTAYSNHFVGFKAGLANTTSIELHFEGYQAGMSNTTGTGNHFSGFQAGMANTSGFANLFSGKGAGRSNTTASFNQFVGNNAGFSNTTGASNYFNGYNAGNANTTGSNNHFVGIDAGSTNTTASQNHFEGYQAGISNTSGAQNYFSGNSAGYSNTTGINNYFSGYHAGYANTTAPVNHFVGFNAGVANTTGTQNHFTGYAAGQTNTTGSNNTAIGYLADVSAGALTNATAIGNGAVVNASNKIRLGNSSVTVIEGQVAFTAASDRRLKTNIQDLDAGLDFILKLRPVSYYMKNQAEPRNNWGFIAQEIESLVGSNNSILTIGGDTDRTLGLRYTDFVAPLVKAVQEQQKTIEFQEEKIKELESKIVKLNNTVIAELDAIKKQLGMEAKTETTSSRSGGNK